MMIERIRREHGYMVRLLAILRHKLNEIKEENAINYSLVSEIVDYLSNHSEKNSSSERRYSLPSFPQALR